MESYSVFKIFLAISSSSFTNAMYRGRGESGDEIVSNGRVI